MVVFGRQFMCLVHFFMIFNVCICKINPLFFGYFKKINEFCTLVKKFILKPNAHTCAKRQFTIANLLN